MNWVPMDHESPEFAQLLVDRIVMLEQRVAELEQAIPPGYEMKIHGYSDKLTQPFAVMTPAPSAFHQTTPARVTYTLQKD